MKRIFVAAFAMSLLPAAPAAALAQTRGLPALPYLPGTFARVPAGRLPTNFGGGPLSNGFGSGISSPYGSVTLPRLNGSLAPSLTSSLTPSPAPALPYGSVVAAPAAALPELTNAAASLAAAAASPKPAAGQALALGGLFEGERAASVDFGLRPTNPWEDARVGRAVETLSRSPVGRDIYAAVYRDYGTSLRVRIDDAANASYDARLSWENGVPVLYLTESLMRRSEAVIGAYMVRELADVYYRSFPASAERGFLSYAAMLQTYAETARAWEPDVQRYFESWRDAVKGVDERRYASLQDSPFFRDFLTTIDDSNTEPGAKLTLREQHRRGMITYGDYNNYQSYITTLHRSQADWLSGKGY